MITGNIVEANQVNIFVSMLAGHFLHLISLFALNVFTKL